MNKKDIIVLVASSILVISFFLPWIDVLITTISGYRIPTLATQDWLESPVDASNWIYLLYAIPILPIFISYGSLMKNDRLIILSEIGIVLVFTYISYEILSRIDTLKILAIGFYLSALASIALAVDGYQRFNSVLDERDKENIREGKKWLFGLLFLIIICLILAVLLVN